MVFLYSEEKFNAAKRNAVGKVVQTPVPTPVLASAPEPLPTQTQTQGIQNDAPSSMFFRYVMVSIVVLAIAWILMTYSNGRQRPMPYDGLTDYQHHYYTPPPPTPPSEPHTELPGPSHMTLPNGVGGGLQRRR
jgi:hypothetical protein